MDVAVLYSSETLFIGIEFEFQIIFTCHKIFFLWLYFNHLKSEKAFLAYWATQNQKQASHKGHILSNSDL